jgi:hypothetical protein
MPGDKREFFASRAGAYGYEVVHTAEAVWIRRIFRCSGQEAPLAIRKGPRWDARTPWDSASSKFFEGYAATKYGEGQRGLSANYPQYSLSPFASTDPERWVAPGFVAATAWAACCATTIRQLERGTSFRTVRWSLSSRRSPGNGVVTEYPYRRLLLYHAGLRRHFALDAHAARRSFQTYDPAQDGHGTLGREGQACASSDQLLLQTHRLSRDSSRPHHPICGGRERTQNALHLPTHRRSIGIARHPDRLAERRRAAREGEWDQEFVPRRQAAGGVGGYRDGHDARSGEGSQGDGPGLEDFAGAARPVGKHRDVLTALEGGRQRPHGCSRAPEEEPRTTSSPNRPAKRAISPPLRERLTSTRGARAPWLARRRSFSQGR